MTKKRLKPEIRKNQILIAALSLAAEGHYTQVSRDKIAALCGVTGTAVQHHFGTMKQLRRAIIRYAIANSNHKVVAQAIIANDPAVSGLTDEQRAAALGAF